MGNITETLAHLLIRRGELQRKVKQLEPFDRKELFEMQVQRQQVGTSIDYDELNMAVPKVSMANYTKEYDWYRKRLRLCDAVIQETNWKTQVQIDPTIMEDFQMAEGK